MTLMKKSQGVDFLFDSHFDYLATANVMDKWILANCQSLLLFMNQEMAGKHLGETLVLQHFGTHNFTTSLSSVHGPAALAVSLGEPD